MSSEALKKGWTGGESEMPQALNSSFCSLTDTVEFGEVVLQPPELTVQPRRSIGRDAVRGDQVMQGVGSVRSFLYLLGANVLDFELLNQSKPFAIFFLSERVLQPSLSFLSPARSL